MKITPGAHFNNDGHCSFRVWAPSAQGMELLLKDRPTGFPMEKDSQEYWSIEMKDISPGTRYKFRIEGQLERPDPASRYQPDGVHSWSAVVDHRTYQWEESSWEGLNLEDLIIYELHVGTFTPQGSFEAVLSKLDHLLKLGINAIEIMPVSAFPGIRNWGYDGVYPYAVQSSYGGPKGLKKMIDGCHKRGVAVILDAVYNHMGPEGNYLGDFGPYFTEKYKTPWGKAINFDDRYCDGVRNFFLSNAQMWLKEYRIDGLRLDAVHEILDLGAIHFLRELSEVSEKVQEETGRKKLLIAESDLNDVKLISPHQIGGYGLQAQWTDDFHHSIHTLLTAEHNGYYSDYGRMEQLEKSFRQAMVYDGIYSPYRKRRIGSKPAGSSPEQFVVSIQNHDQVGNRMRGERLSMLLGLEQLKLAAGLMLTAPFTPMLFMGEEFGADQPFQYFVSHGDAELVQAVQEGRRKEFQYFRQSTGDFPDPQAEKTFEDSKLDWDIHSDPQKELLLGFYQELIRLRKKGTFQPFRNHPLKTWSDETSRVLSIRGGALLAIFNLHARTQEVTLPTIGPSWKKIIASADTHWKGRETVPESLEQEQVLVPGHSFLLLESH